jgi:hypothetical protein
LTRIQRAQGKHAGDQHVLGCRCRHIAADAAVVAATAALGSNVASRMLTGWPRRWPQMRDGPRRDAEAPVGTAVRGDVARGRRRVEVRVPDRAVVGAADAQLRHAPRRVGPHPAPETSPPPGAPGRRPRPVEDPALGLAVETAVALPQVTKAGQRHGRGERARDLEMVERSSRGGRT